MSCGLVTRRAAHIALALLFCILIRAVPALAQGPSTQAVSWGYSGFNLREVPPLPPGLNYSGLSAGNYHSVALRSDGLIVAWGNPNGGVLAVPLLPKGVTYTAVSAGSSHTLALRSDGGITAWGSNAQGQCNVPTAPAGVRYTAISAGYLHSVAIRSDGLVVAWGLNTNGQCNVPSLPLTLFYTSIAAGESFTIALRTDGRIVAFGANNVGQRNVPSPVNGGSFVAIAAGGNHGLALRSNGTIAGWGSNGYQQTVAPTLPEGVTYTGIDAGHFHSLGLRSDNFITAWGQNFYGQTDVPVLNPGASFIGISAGHLQSMALYSTGVPAGTAFTFNGHLATVNGSVNGSADLRFKLFDHPTAGMQRGPAIELAAFPVTGGLFTAQLDFGPNAFDGSARFLQMEVRAGNDTAFIPLNPRQALTPTPYASFAARAGSADVAVTAQNAQVATSAESIPWGSIIGIPASIIDGGPWTVLASGDLSAPDRSVSIGGNQPASGFRLDVLGNIKCVGLTQTSTAALKSDVLSLENGLDLALKLRPVRFTWNQLADASVVGKRDVGFIAEEVALVLPEVVSRDERGTVTGLDYGRLTTVAIAAVKAQEARLDRHERAIKAAEGENDDLAAKLRALECLVAQLKAQIEKSETVGGAK